MSLGVKTDIIPYIRSRGFLIIVVQFFENFGNRISSEFSVRHLLCYVSAKIIVPVF